MAVAGSSPASGSFWPIAVNLSALVLLGFAVCAWFLHYTDLFPEVLNLLSLGGIFAWIAFLANILSKERKEDFQHKFETHVLLPKRTLAVIFLIASVFFLAWASRRGTIVVSTHHDDKNRTIEIRSRDRKGEWKVIALKEESLPSREQRKYALPTSWFGSREYRVKVSGLPAAVADIEAWRKKSLSVPDAFDVPLVLVHPSLALSVSLQKTPVGGTLSVSADGKPIGKLPSYRGEAVWIGGDKDIDIPERILSGWRLELFRNQAPQETLARWLPSASINPAIGIFKGQRIDVSLITPSQRNIIKTIVVTPPYPQEVTLDESNSDQP